MHILKSVPLQELKKCIAGPSQIPKNKLTKSPKQLKKDKSIGIFTMGRMEFKNYNS